MVVVLGRILTVYMFPECHRDDLITSRTRTQLKHRDIDHLASCLAYGVGGPSGSVTFTATNQLSRCPLHPVQD